jgi:phospholipid transport system transporter-binding protein
LSTPRQHVATHARSDDDLRLSPVGAGRFAAHGRLTFTSARAAREVGLAAIQGASGDLRIDCSGIGGCDSAGMAVLLDWLAGAKRAGRSLCFDNLPQQVEALGRISDVAELLERGV